MTAALEMPCHFAALQLDGALQTEPAALHDRIEGWLAELGHEVETGGPLPDGAIWLRTAVATIRLASDGPARLILHVAERATARPTAEGEALLLNLTYRLAARLSPRRIEWQADGSCIDTADFMEIAGRAAGRIRPMRPGAIRRGTASEPRPARLPALVDNAFELQLREAFRAADAEAEGETGEDSPQQRFAAWAFSGAAALLCLPLAPVLLAVNLRHGPDPRLPAQACSLLGLYFALDHSGAYADLAALMPI
ncbi:MAG: hypothetical protein ACOCXK_00300 [Rhodosalinus sp.]